MAARQAEHQHKEVIRDQINSEQVGDLANVSLQNGTDKNGPRLHGTPGVPENVNNKGKLVGPNSLSSGLAMSQYRQESGAISSNSNSEPNLNNTDVDTAKINSESVNRAYTQNVDVGSEPSYNKVSDSGFPLGYSRGGYCEQPGELQYSPQAQPGIRHNFPGSKPLVSIPPRPPSAGTNSQQRFMSGQSISQQAGPTPTLNQLLQSSNRYGDMKGGEHPYNHWPSSYGVQHMPPGFRNQSPYGGGGPQQPWPGAAHHHLHHPASPAPTGGPPPAVQQQQPSQTPSPQPQPPQQPQPSASPHQQQQQGFSGRPQEAPDAADLTLSGQNSNDSSTGPAPGTPMRPSPSPTGSSGSRSMSPAVGQQNIPMPPRPSSGQSDGSGPARISHSPMATQGGYPQPLAPPPHMHGYKVGAHPGMTPTNQQIPYPSQAQQYSQGNYNSPRPMTGAQYGPNQYGPTPGPGAGSQPPPNSNSMAPGQYPGRGIPNHVPHSQFSGYQGWGNPNMNQGPPPGLMGGPGNHVTGGKGTGNSTSSGGNSSSGAGSGGGSGSSNPVAPGPQSGPPSSSAGASPQTPPPQPQGPQGPRPHTPPHYLKQHLQHKMSFGGSSPGPPGPQSQVGPPQGGPPLASPSAPGTPPQGGPPQSGPQSGLPSQSGPPQGGGPLQGGLPQGGPPASPSPGGIPPSPGMGPPSMHHPMGPPMAGPPMPAGPPMAGPPGSHMGHPPSAMGPPVPLSPGGAGPGPSSGAGCPSPVSNSHGHHDGPMPPPPPASTPNSHTPLHSMASVPHSDNEMVHDNGITTTAGGTTTTNVSPATGVTCVVTTGPDGTPVDEASQQSTLSNASAASGEDPTTTPKSRKDGLSLPYHSHPATPQSTVPSPGPTGINSMHEDYEMSSPNNWPRTPASPVFNSHVPPDPYRTKKPDSLGKLYEMDDSVERKIWLDKLLQFMEDRGTPISACPTISKNPLDLFRLYSYVKERGGFMEVTKNKTWKDIAGQLGIGASSSAAYTLRKHYTKNLLPLECHFDRGGIDPQPIINQVEAGSKKKNAKAAPVPSPGSSNSQDSFPAPGSGGASMDGYSYGYPPSSGQDYNSQRAPPSSQTNSASPHPGVGVPPHGAGDNVSVANPFDDGVPGHGPGPGPGQGQRPSSYGPPYGTPATPGNPRSGPQGYQGQGAYQYGDQYNRGPPGPEYNQQYPPGSTFPSNRSMYPPYGPEGDRGYNQGGSSGQPPGTPGPDPYNRYQPPGYQPRPGYPAHPGQAPPSSPAAGQQSVQPQDFYRSDQISHTVNVATSQLARRLIAPQPYGQPRRHPDFVKDQPPYPGFNQNRPAMYGGWPNNSQYRGQYPPPGNSASGSQQWSQGPPRPSVPPTNQQPNSGQWCQPSYQSPQQAQQWGPTIPAPGAGPNASLRPIGSRPPYRQDGKPYAMASALSGVKGQPPSSQAPSPMSQSSVPPKREITFPPDSVEATMPVLYKRKRLSRADVYPVEAWRLMMSLRSGLLSESCWALDTLNILLFDDMSVVYFGLQHMPGLLDILLEHFGKALDAMFDMNTTHSSRKWFEKIKEEEEEVDLGSVSEVIDPADKTQVLPPTCPNYSMVTRKGRPVKLVNRDDVFVLDTRKSWDVHGDAPEEMGEADPASASNLTKYIVPCFQGEFGLVPFVRLIPGPDKKRQREEGASDSVTNGIGESDEAGELNGDVGGDTGIGSSEPKEPKQEPKEPVEQPSLPKTEPPSCATEEERISSEGCVSVNEVDRKRKKRTKCLTDVLNRIKKEKGDTNSATEVNAFPRDCVDKIGVVVKKELEDLVNSDDSESRSNSHDRNEPVEDSKVVDENHVCDSDGDVERMDVDESKVSGSENDCEESKRPQLRIRDPAGVLKRRRMADYEDECYTRDEASLYLVTENQDSVARRCVCLSNILRNLTFVPGNELEFAKNSTFLGLLGKLMLVHHEHPLRTTNQRNYDREEDADYLDSCSSITGDNEWWWDFLNQLRENVLVTMANIAGYVDLGGYPEEISRPLLDGLLHWAVCPAAHGQDPFPTVGPSSALSPQRLALEALCKLCVTDSNVDLVIATPPYSRLERLCTVLTKLLCRSEEQVLREFAVNLLHYLAAADSGMARTVASQTPCVSMLVAFIEQAEQSALGVANQHGIGALRENPDSMGTSLDMLRRAAGTLLHLARHPDNRPLFLQQEQRLLALVMSQVLDQQVAAVVSSVLFQCSRGQSPTVHTTS